MSDFDIGTPGNDDDLAALRAERRRTYNVGADDAEAWLDRARRTIDDIRVVRRGGRIAGGAWLIPMAQWFGGRSVPMTGIGGVGVDPHERATGAGSALMRSIVEELHAAGCALSTLYPATQPVYRRVGYEIAGSRFVYSIPANLVDVRDRSLDIELCDPVTADALAGMYDDRARSTSGNLDRTERFWERIEYDPKGELQGYRVNGSSGPEGYVVFTQSGRIKFDLNVRDMVALTPSAARRLWTFFADHRSFVDKVTWVGGPGDPFAYHLREQEWDVDSVARWMVRVIDVERALAERGYPAGLEAEVHLAVADDVLPRNHASFVLRVADGKAEVTRGGRGSVKIDVRGLAPLYTGFLAPQELVATGYIEGPDEDLARAAAIFAGPAPWLADYF